MWFSSLKQKILDYIFTAHDSANRLNSASVCNSVTVPPTGGHEFTAAPYHSLMRLLPPYPQQQVYSGELETHTYPRAEKRGYHGLRSVHSRYKGTCANTFRLHRDELGVKTTEANRNMDQTDPQIFRDTQWAFNRSNVVKKASHCYLKRL